MDNGISVIWAGDYNSNKTYYKNQAVFYNGSSYRANKTTTQEPSLTAVDWDLLAQGIDGEIDLSEITDELDDLTGELNQTQATLASHILNTSNPHSVTAAQVGNSTAQWNADKLKGVTIDDSAKANGRVLKYNSATNVLEYSSDLIGEGGVGAGEVNTASNVGVGGVGLFKQKSGVNLEFKNLNAGSNKIAIANDSTNNEVDIDVNEANLTLGNLSGTLPITKGGTGSTSATAALTALGAASSSSLSSHTSNTSNPHNTTASQVGNTTAQWNADKIQGVDVVNTAPTSGQVLTYNSTTTKWEPTTFSSSQGKVVQVVYGSSNTITTVAAGSFTNIGLSVQITPVSTSNILYFTVVIQGIEKVSGTADTTYIIGAQLYNTTTSSTVYSTGTSYGGRFTAQYLPPYSFQGQAAITTTGALTFNVRISAQSGSIRFQSNNAVSNIIMMEVAL